MLGTISPHAIDGSPEAVRAQHALMHRRLRRQMDLHKSHISEEGWALLTRVAFALYVDSREETWRVRDEAA